MGPKTVLVAIAVFGVAVLANADTPVPEPRLPESFKWFSPPGNPGLKATWIVGAEQASGLYALRVRLVAGAKIAPHTHPDARYSTVLSGTLYVGFGEAVDESTMVAVPAGGVYVAPANKPHYLWARDGEVVYQESGVGPTGTAAVAGQQKWTDLKPWSEANGRRSWSHAREVDSMAGRAVRGANVEDRGGAVRAQR